MEIVEKIYKILTHRKIRKAWPTSSDGVKKNIKQNLELDDSVILTTTWLGVKTTDGGTADGADKAALVFLKSIVKEINKLGIEVNIKLLFSDNYASYLQGYSQDRIRLYWRTLRDLTEESGKFIKLIGLNSYIYQNLFKLDGREEGISLKLMAEKLDAQDIFKKTSERAEEIFKSPIFAKFKILSRKHSLFVKNNLLSSEDAARRYIQFRLFDLCLYKKIFPHEIYFSYTDKTLMELIICQPIFYFFSIYKGFSDCPWFIGEDCKKLQDLIKAGKIRF